MEDTTDRSLQRGEIVAKCKILFLAANPGATERLALDEEIRAIDRQIRASDFRDSLQLVSRWAVRPDDLLQSFNEVKPQIVHFSGHGDSNSALLLQGDDGETRPVSESVLTKLFHAFRNDIRLVVLNACFSKSQAKSITSSIDCAIGMSSAVGDTAAIHFAASFYRAIGFGCSVQESFDQGVLAVEMSAKNEGGSQRGATFDGQELARVGEHSKPRLLAKSGVSAQDLVLVSEPEPNKPSSVDRSISIGGNVTGGVVVSGNQNVVNQVTRIQTSTNNSQINTVQIEVNKLKSQLLSLASSNQKKIARAFEDVEDELENESPDRDEVGESLQRALRFSAEVPDFDSCKAQAATHVKAIVAWLGGDWERLRNYFK